MAESERVVASAERDSDAAVATARVEVRELREVAELERVCELFNEIWRPAPDNPPITSEVLRALAKSGNYVAGAFEREHAERAEHPDHGARLVGAAFSFCGPPEGRAMHSHVAGVSPNAAGRHVGYALKLHQRAWALRRGIATMTWTFDPLIRRNAYFNLVKLGASAAEYLVDFYGPMHDGVNAGAASDRILARWDLDAPAVGAACAGRFVPADAEAQRRAGATVALAVGADGGPTLSPALSPVVGAATVLVEVPADIESLRGTDPALARAWRMALREVLTGLLSGGATVDGFDRAGWYVLSGADRGGNSVRTREESTS